MNWLFRPAPDRPLRAQNAAQSAPRTAARRAFDCARCGVTTTSSTERRAIALHLALIYLWHTDAQTADIPLWVALTLGGAPLVWELLGKVWAREFGADLLAGISIVTAIVLSEYLAGTLVVTMLSGGEALESYALANASSVLKARAKRMPAVAHRKGASGVEDVALDEIEVGDILVLYPHDILVLYPHDICPVGGLVVEGHGAMNEAYLTGEPFEITKIVGAAVISGAINGDAVLSIRATQRASDSRHAKIMRVMRESETTRPHLRRLGDKLGAIYTPLALTIALTAWAWSHDPTRFLSVLVIATPCPLLIAIPVAIIGSISLCARRSIIVKSPVVMEQITGCRTAIFDKTGTLTCGQPSLTEMILAPHFERAQVLKLVASLEHYSRHPLARAMLAAADEAGIEPLAASEVSGPPGQGLVGLVEGQRVRVTSRSKFIKSGGAGAEQMPPTASGLECVVAIGEVYAATLRFRDAPRDDSRSLVRHLRPKHGFTRIMIVSGDRESEARYLGQQVGIREVYAGQTPEQKLAIVRAQTAKSPTLYVGDGINDAPAMMAATVGIAIGQNSDVTTQATGAVIMDNSIARVDEFFHISRRMKTIALQSAVGGMALSGAGMLLAAGGFITPVNGAIAQEVIDVLAVLNALRAAFPPKTLVDR